MTELTLHLVLPEDWDRIDLLMKQHTQTVRLKYSLPPLESFHRFANLGKVILQANMSQVTHNPTSVEGAVNSSMELLRPDYTRLSRSYATLFNQALPKVDFRIETLVFVERRHRLEVVSCSEPLWTILFTDKI